MRPTVVAVMLLAIARLAIAGNAATVREPTRIPQGPLGQALRTLANERGFQVVYVSGQVDRRRTRGASGNLTIDEALMQVLRGTGFTFHQMSGGGIVIEPIARPAAAAAPHAPPSAVAQSAPPDSNGSSSDATPAQLGRVTIQASKDRQRVRRQVDHFVASVVLRPWDDALKRWNEPICPLIAGLPKAFGELILERISRAAVDAHAPLAEKGCHPNLYVVASDSPDRLLEKWWAHDRRMYDYQTVGIEAVERFIHSPRPIRVWYNIGLSCRAGMPADPGVPLAFLGPVGIVPLNCGGVDTHLVRKSTWSNITSAIVVLDPRRLTKVTIGQMADYVALVSLADVRLDGNPGPEPSILQLFAQTAPPKQLSVWDRALLYSLYNSDQWSMLQMSQLKSTMVKRIAR